MFENLSNRLTRTIEALRGQGRLTDQQVERATRELRMALLEADVALPVVRAFIERVRERAVGAEVQASLTPGQALLTVVHQELTAVLGGSAEPLNLRAQPPAVILMAGLQGSGKTTTTAKLALLLGQRERKKVTVVSADVYRPAAIDQLRKLAEQIGADWFPSRPDQRPEEIAEAALAEARRRYADVLIVDTAGRTAVDAEMMAEIAALHRYLTPVETLFVVDAMTGQDAARTAKAFAETVPLTGVVLSKADGDARGGAALSVRMVTGAPIKFLGTGEKPQGLEVFHPQRIAARILGEGDVLGLIEETAQRVDQAQVKRLSAKLRSRRGFDLEDFREQLLQVQKLGDLRSVLDKLPGGARVKSRLAQAQPEHDLSRSVAIIGSMTPAERRRPELIKASRKRRIAAGAGVHVQQVNLLLKQFETSRQMMKKVSGGGLGRMLGAFSGRLPPGLLPPGR